MMVYVIPAIAFVAGLAAAHVAARAGHWRAPAIWSAALLAAMLWAIWAGRQHAGWDAIGYGILAGLMLAPAVLGSLAGLVTGLYRRRREGQEARHDRDA